MAAAAPRMAMQQSDFKRRAQHPIFDVLCVDYNYWMSHCRLIHGAWSGKCDVMSEAACE